MYFRLGDQTQSSSRIETFFLVVNIDPLAELVFLGEGSLERLPLFFSVVSTHNVINVESYHGTECAGLFTVPRKESGIDP